MTANGAWDSPASSTTSHDSDNLEDDREAMLARLSKELAMSMRQSYNENNDNTNNSSHNDNRSHGQQNLYPGLSGRYNPSDQETPWLSSSSDEEDSFPELSVTLSDPEGSRLDELLYWVS